MKKYLLEIGGISYYLGHSIQDRWLYDTYEEAKAEFDKRIEEKYGEMSVEEFEELSDECSGHINPEYNYIDDWDDGECDLYLFISEVEYKGGK